MGRIERISRLSPTAIPLFVLAEAFRTSTLPPRDETTSRAQYSRACAVAGGVIGNRVDRNHVGGQVVNRTQRQCHTTTSTSQSTRVVGYEVTYRNPDGTTGTMRTDRKPGERIALGMEDVPVAYDVTYRYDGQERTVRMPDRPTDNRLPVVDGQVVAQVDAVPGTSRQ